MKKGCSLARKNVDFTPNRPMIANKWPPNPNEKLHIQMTSFNCFYLAWLAVFSEPAHEQSERNQQMLIK